MADAALFIGFGPAARALVPQVPALFGEAVELYGRLQQDGQIESFEPVLLQPHGGDLAGFFLIRGGLEQLTALQADPEFLRINARAVLVVDNFGVVPAYIGEGLGAQMELYEVELRDQLAS